MANPTLATFKTPTVENEPMVCNMFLMLDATEFEDLAV